MSDSPQTDPDLIVHCRQPFNAEPPLSRLRASWLTPRQSFYVRTHGEIPRPELATYRLRVAGRVAVPLSLSLAELQARFPHRRMPAVLQCAGNRRADLQHVRPVSGDPWMGGAIGHAEWTGVALGDVLRAARLEDRPDLHVVFTCLDACEVEDERFHYEVSIPLAKAVAPEVVLAWAMNGEALRPEHGAPLRAVVPGFAGVRSAKWLAAVTVQDKPSDGHMQARDYKLFPSDVSKDTVEWSQGLTINDMPLTSAICEPAAHALLRAGACVVRGYAVATAPRAVMRVDISANGGRSWQQATLEADPQSPWSWTFWKACLDLPAGEHEVVVRAWDSAGQTQPASPDDVWNFKGYLASSWHRVPVRAE